MLGSSNANIRAYLCRIVQWLHFHARPNNYIHHLEAQPQRDVQVKLATNYLFYALSVIQFLSANEQKALGFA